MKNSKSTKSKIAAPAIAGLSTVSALISTAHTPVALIGTIAPSKNVMGAEKLFTRYSFDDNGGGYMGL